MTLVAEIMKNLSGYSMAKYSTWFYYKPDNLLFDVGEGVSIGMRNTVYAVEKIVISHGHGDHVAGLHGFLSSRASSMGDRLKPVDIYYPQGDRNTTKLKAYIESTLEWLPFDVRWYEMLPGNTVQLAPKRFLETFATRHNVFSLGYKIVEVRSRLKAQYQGLEQKEIKQIIQNLGKQEIVEEYRHTLLCFSGDCMPLPVEVAQNAEVLLHDSTFLSQEDRDGETHATVEEALCLGRKCNVSSLGLFHFSARYTRNDVLKKIQKSVQDLQIEFPVFYMFPYNMPFSFKPVIPESEQPEQVQTMPLEMEQARHLQSEPSSEPDTKSKAKPDKPMQRQSDR